MQRQPDIALARKVLGWEPKIRLIDGLRKTIDYFDKLLAEDRPSKKSAKRRR
jgi:nucleoside-diphosphate-sugar epimerase